VPPARGEVVVIASDVFVTEMEKERMAEFPEASVTVTLTVADMEALEAAARAKAWGSVTAA
jgi:hypothetical protein